MEDADMKAAAETQLMLELEDVVMRRVAKVLASVMLPSYDAKTMRDHIDGPYAPPVEQIQPAFTYELLKLLLGSAQFQTEISRMVREELRRATLVPSQQHLTTSSTVAVPTFNIMLR